MSAVDKKLLRGLMRKKIEDEEDILSQSQEGEDPIEALSPSRRSGKMGQSIRVVSGRGERKETQGLVKRRSEIEMKDYG